MNRISIKKHAPRGRSRGLSLVELLVASAIGIIASLAIFQVFAVFEGQKRTTTSGGEAQTNGTLALHSVEREVRLSGYGFNAIDLVGCTAQGWDQTAGAALTPWTLAPIVISQGAGGGLGIAGAPDTITVMFGNGDQLPAPVTLGVNSLGVADDFFKIFNPFGIRAGDVVMLGEAGKPCTLAQVNQVPPATGDSTRFNVQPGQYLNASGAPVNTRYNNPGGLGTAYTTNGKVLNLGEGPTIKTFSVQNSQLVSQALGAATATPLYDSIVQLQAQYGKDTTNDGVVDVFEDASPTTTAEWASVLAVRIALVARSSLYEKDQVSPASIRLWEDCLSTTVPPCPLPPYTTGPVWTLTADERHYRYKVFQTVIPLRNMIWRPQ